MVDQIDKAIVESTLHEHKTAQIHTIAKSALNEYNDELPDDFAVRMGFVGIGPKCANLTLGIACGIPLISVDVHTHHITNRWGYVVTGSPSQKWIPAKNLWK